MTDIHLLRKTLKTKRNEVSKTMRSQSAKRLLTHLLKQNVIDQATHIAIYYPFDGELDPTPFQQWAAVHKKIIYLPVLHADLNTLFFARYEACDILRKNRFGIMEPLAEAHLLFPAEDLDIICLPLVGFNRQGVRLGMGAGYYDKTLSFCANRSYPHRPFLLGFAYGCQEHSDLQAKPWDILLDAIVTENEWIDVQPQQLKYLK